MKKYTCLLLVFALVLSLSTAAFAEEEIENGGQEPVVEIKETAPAEDYDPPPKVTENIEENEKIGVPVSEGETPEESDGEDTVTEPEEPDVSEYENVATPSDAEKSPEEPEEPEAPPMLMTAPPENGEDDGTGETHVVTVSWEVENAAIDISSSSSYVWNTETLQYEKQSSESIALGDRRTVEVSITIANQYGSAVYYNIAYNPDNSVLENGEVPSGEAPSSGQIASGESLIYTGTVIVTGIINSEPLDGGTVITLGSYSVTISSAEST